MSRHRLLGIALLLGCSQSSAPHDTLRIPLINDPVLNPVLAMDVGSIEINKVIFPGLVRPDSLLHPEPDLAESWRMK